MTKGHRLFAQRSAGALLHVTSLPTRFGIGDLGPEALRFIEWLQRAGFTWWQMLPVGPTGPGNSPYSSPSSFAGEPLLLSLEQLQQNGLLERADLRVPARLGRGRVDHDAVRAFKEPRLERAFQRFTARAGAGAAALRKYCRANRGWLEEWVAFQPGDPDLARFLQFEFARQWSALRSAAAARGVRLLGDLPIFVSADSADVRANPELFRLNKKGRPSVVTGVPPDLFSADGQLWGHPHYDWKEHSRTRFRWWIDRVAAQLERFDAIRIDHFIGFQRAYEVSARARTARRGKWVTSPGNALLSALRKKLGGLPFVAEDLGAVTPEVRALRDAFGLPGMRVLQYAFGAHASYDKPHNLPANSVVYTGTHDNDTARGWFRSLPAAERKRVLTYSGGSAHSAPEDLVRLALTSPARTAILPMQDLLGLGGAARMNRPGTPFGNWSWRMDSGALTAARARRLHELCAVTERLRQTRLRGDSPGS